MQKLLRILNYTIPLGKGLLGIPVRVSWLVVFIFLWWGQYGSPLEALVMVPLLYGSIYLHEAGHAAAIRYHGRPVTMILLWPLGGLCFSPSLDRSPTEELLTTLAGPIVNLLLAVPLVGISLLFYRDFPVHFSGGAFNLRGMISFLFLINMFLATFNLLFPVFPLDSARILRALLARRMPAGKATIITANIGLAVAGAIAVLYMLQYVAAVPPMIGSLLFFIAIIGIFESIREKKRVKQMPVYDSAGAFRVVYNFGTPDAWQGSGFGKAPAARKPGLLARFKAKLEKKRVEKRRKRGKEHREEVERILDKISKQGLNSLTNREKAVLKKESEQLRHGGS